MYCDGEEKEWHDERRGTGWGGANYVCLVRTHVVVFYIHENFLGETNLTIKATAYTMAYREFAMYNEATHVR